MKQDADCANQYYETIINHITIDLAIFDTALRYIYIHPTAVRRPEVREWLIGHNDFEYCRKYGKPIEMAERRTEAIARCRDEKITVTFEEELKGPDDESKFILRRVIPICDEDDNVVQILGYGVDVTERKLAQMQMKNIQNIQQQILDNIPIQVALFDSELRYKYVNPASISNPEIREWIIGKTDAEYCKRRNRDLEIARGREIWRLRAISERKPVSFEEKLETAGGKQQHYLRMHAPVFNKDGELTEVIGYGLDITDRKHAEEQLQQAQKMDAIGQLAGGVAHDFNNMLSVILGNAEIAKCSLELSDSLRARLDEIESAAERAATLTRQLLAFSRHQVMLTRVTNLNTILRDLQPMLRRLIREDILLDIKYDSDLCDIKTDPGQVEQVIVNLAVNARDAMPEGGRLCLVTANVDFDEACGVL